MEQETELIEKPKEEQLLEILPTVRQLVHRELAMWATRNYGDDTYHLFKAVNLIMADVGTDILKKHYGKNYQLVIERIKNIGKIASEVKIYYDGLDSKTKKEKEEEIDSKRFIKYKKKLCKLSLVSGILYEVFVLLINKTKLKYKEIPNEAFKIAEREYKKFEFGKEGRTQKTKDDDK